VSQVEKALPKGSKLAATPTKPQNVAPEAVPVQSVPFVEVPAVGKAAPSQKPKSIVTEASSTNLVVEKSTPTSKISPTNATASVSSGTSSSSLAASTFRDKVAQFKSAHAVDNDDVLAELVAVKAHCRELEEEVSGLRARLEIAAAGKEALVMQILALERRENVHLLQNTNQSPDQALAHAKDLLKQGKISKSQFLAASKAAAESKALLSGRQSGY